MATLEQLSAALVKADAAGNADDARALADEIRRMRAAPASPAEPKSKGYIADRLGEAGDMLGGAVKGASQIGATLLAPMDIAKDAIAGKGLSLESNRQRRKDVSEALTGMGADLNSTAGQAGQIVTEIAGTAGVGGAIAAPLRAVAPRLAQAVSTAGMRTGGPAAATMGARAADLGIRTAGGAATGGAAAGIINPEDAATGAAIGGALPGALAVAGRVGGAIGRTVAGPAQAPEMQAAVTAARGAGYVIPPTQARPTLTNRLLEGFSGKLTTAQNASARNQEVTNRLAATTIGLPGDVPITRDALNAVRRQAGQAYDAVGSSGVITPDPTYEQALDRIVAPYRTAAQGFPNAQQSPVIAAIDSLRSPSFDASAAVAQLRNVREMSDEAFSQGNRRVGRSLREGAEALESAIEAHLQQTGAPQALQEFQDARRLIAQTYSIEKALNPTTGTVDARKLAAQVNKGRPMTGPMRDAADFAARFPKAAQPVEAMGSLPQTNPLDWGAMGVSSAVTGNPLMMAGVLARPAARSLVLSAPVQNRLVQGAAAPNRLAALLNDPRVVQMGYRAAPVLGAQ